MSRPEDAEIGLIKQAAGGNKEAFAQLFHSHFEAVYNYALWLCGDPALTEDLTQEAFIRAHANLSRFGPPWKFRAWLYRLTRNLFIDHQRRERDTEPLEAERPIPSAEGDPEGTLLSGERAERVRHALRHLPAQYREALLLREFDGFAYADIAAIMDLSLSYVKVLLHRARASFKEGYGVQLLLQDPLPPCDVLDELLDSLHDGEALGEQERFVREHLHECPTCQQRQRELVALTDLLGLLVPVAPPRGLEREMLRRVLSSRTSRGPKENKLARAARGVVLLAVVLAGAYGVVRMAGGLFVERFGLGDGDAGGESDGFGGGAEPEPALTATPDLPTPAGGPFPPPDSTDGIAAPPPDLPEPDGSGPPGEPPPVEGPPPAEDSPPAAFIGSPLDGLDVYADQVDGEGQWYFVANLSGGASDPEDGPLSGGSLVWTDSLSGVVGSGADVPGVALYAPACFDNAHTITLTATDSAGNSSSASVNVIVRQLC